MLHSPRERLVATLAGIFGLVTLSLICVGLYGLMAFTVSRRMPEIGIRVALGATRSNVRWLVGRQALGIVLAGLGSGCLRRGRRPARLPPALIPSLPRDVNRHRNNGCGCRRAGCGRYVRGPAAGAASGADRSCGGAEERIGDLSQELQRARQRPFGHGDDRRCRPGAPRGRGVGIPDIDPCFRELLDRFRQRAGTIRQLDEQHILGRKRIAGRRQNVRGQLAIRNQQAHDAFFLSRLRRRDRQQVHAAVREIAAQPRERADLIVHGQVELSRCRHEGHYSPDVLATAMLRLFAARAFSG